MVAIELFPGFAFHDDAFIAEVVDPSATWAFDAFPFQERHGTLHGGFFIARGAGEVVGHHGGAAVEVGNGGRADDESRHAFGFAVGFHGGGIGRGGMAVGAGKGIGGISLRDAAPLAGIMHSGVKRMYACHSVETEESPHLGVFVHRLVGARRQPHSTQQANEARLADGSNQFHCLFLRKIYLLCKSTLFPPICPHFSAFFATNFLFPFSNGHEGTLSGEDVGGNSYGEITRSSDVPLTMPFRNFPSGKETFFEFFPSRKESFPDFFPFQKESPYICT